VQVSNKTAGQANYDNPLGLLAPYHSTAVTQHGHCASRITRKIFLPSSQLLRSYFQPCCSHLLVLRTAWWQVVSKTRSTSVVAVFKFAMDLSDALLDIITVLLGNMELKQRFTCALVCSDWAKIAAAATKSVIGVWHPSRDLEGLKKWLEKNGRHLETLQLHVDCQTDMARLPCTQLQDLLLHGHWGSRLTLDSRVWNDIAAATKLTSVSLQRVFTDSQQADVVSALTALPALQQLAWEFVECEQQRELSDSRLLQQLTKLTRLDLSAVSAEALQHLGSVSKLQHLGISEAPEWVATNFPGLQHLTPLTSLQLYYGALGLPPTVSHLTALQQLEVSAATPTQLNGLTGLTALTKLRVHRLTHDSTPLQLPALYSLDMGVELSEADNFLHMPQLSSCTQLRKLALTGFCLAGPGSLAANSMLKELHLCDCDLRNCDEARACQMDRWLLFPGPGRLPHLTSLTLCSADPAPEQADLQQLVACCSGLRRLELAHGSLSWRLTSASAYECLSRLSTLVTLELGVVDDQQCSSLAQLTGLQELRVMHPDKLSTVGLRHLARLQSLTSLSFENAFNPYKVSPMLQVQLSDRTESGCPRALVNKVRRAAAGLLRGVGTMAWRSVVCDSDYVKQCRLSRAGAGHL